VVNKVAELPAGQGFNAATLEYGDLAADGIVDPVKVTRSAVLNAASVARMVLTTETAIVEKPAEEEAHAGHGQATATRTEPKSKHPRSKRPGVFFGGSQWSAPERVATAKKLTQLRCGFTFDVTGAGVLRSLGCRLNGYQPERA
jgi:hypothetical protein